MNLTEYKNDLKEKSDILNQILKTCRTLLKYSSEAAQARDYLNGRLTKVYQEEFSFGYFPASQELGLLTEVVPESKLKELGLIINRPTSDGDYLVGVKHSYFHHNNLIMPYRDVYGQLIGLVGRTLHTPEETKEIENSQGIHIVKYKNSDLRKSQHLFGLHHAKEEIINKGYVIVVEGQFDCLTCYDYGIYNVVALGGVAFSKTQLFLLLRYTDTIHLLLDNDTEGLRATNKIRERYSKYATINVMNLPENTKDMAIYLKNGNDYNDLKIS